MVRERQACLGSAGSESLKSGPHWAGTGWSPGGTQLLTSSRVTAGHPAAWRAPALSYWLEPLSLSAQVWANWDNEKKNGFITSMLNSEFGKKN